MEILRTSLAETETTIGIILNKSHYYYFRIIKCTQKYRKPEKQLNTTCCDWHGIMPVTTTTTICTERHLGATIDSKLLYIK